MVYDRPVSKKRRTQIYLDQDQMSWLKLEASHRKTTMSNLIRDAVGHLVKERRRVDWENDPIAKLVGAFKGGPPDLAEEHDHYIYGGPKRRFRKT